MMVGISEMMMTEDADCVRVSMCVEVLCQPKRKLVEMMCVGSLCSPKRKLIEMMCIEFLCPPKRKRVEKEYRRHLYQVSSVTLQACSGNKENLP
jgi:hypothetical protein